MKKRKQKTEDSNAQLTTLLNNHKRGGIKDLELAILCGKTVKTKMVK